MYLRRHARSEAPIVEAPGRTIRADQYVLPNSISSFWDRVTLPGAEDVRRSAARLVHVSSRRRQMSSSITLAVTVARERGAEASSPPVRKQIPHSSVRKNRARERKRERKACFCLASVAYRERKNPSLILGSLFSISFDNWAKNYIWERAPRSSRPPL